MGIDVSKSKTGRGHSALSLYPWIVSALFFGGCTSPSGNRVDSPQWRDDRFQNALVSEPKGFVTSLSTIWRALTQKPRGTVPDGAIPVMPLLPGDLAAAPNGSLFRLGHSTVLLKLHGGLWLTDPVFSERVSPLPSLLGPKRFHAPPISLEDLPAVAGVILSHDHYDHLDKASVLLLAPKVGVFVAPRGVGDLLIAWGIAPTKIRQLDWWEQTEAHGVQVVAVPAQHSSGRGPGGGKSNQALWASFVIRADGLSIFFSGDTGYHGGFKEIGDRYGPFDVAMIENGGYDPLWADMHLQPEQTLQALSDLRGKWLVPVHNGTFDLARHSWSEPFERIAALAARADVQVATPRMGERLDMFMPNKGAHWWEVLTQGHRMENTNRVSGS